MRGVLKQSVPQNNGGYWTYPVQWKEVLPCIYLARSPKKSGLLFKRQRPGPRRKQLRAINSPDFVSESDVFEACMHVTYYAILKYALYCFLPLLLSIFLSSFSSSFNPLMQTLNPSFCITRRRIFSTISSILIHLVSLHQSYCRARVLFKTCVMKEWTDMMRYLM